MPHCLTYLILVAVALALAQLPLRLSIDVDQPIAARGQRRRRDGRDGGRDGRRRARGWLRLPPRGGGVVLRRLELRRRRGRQQR